MKVSFVFPSSGVITGGNYVMYQLANHLAARGNEVNFFHGPAIPGRIATLDEVPPMCVGYGVRNFIVDSLEDETLPAADVIFVSNAPRRLGLPASLIQGFKMLQEATERVVFTASGPKFCVATWLAEVGVREFGSPASEFLHVPLGLDHERFHLESSLADRPIDVAVMCHPHREKGWPVAVAALEELRRRRPTARLLVFGRVPPDDCPPGVEFVDSPDAIQLADEIYGQAKIFVQSSRHEGFGYTPVEAMACGAALVTTDCGGSRDYAFDGKTAVVVAPDAPEALAEAVDALLDDEPRRLQLAANGAEYIRRFQWATSGEILEQHLERYISDPSRFPGVVA